MTAAVSGSLESRVDVVAPNAQEAARLAALEQARLAEEARIAAEAEAARVAAAARNVLPDAPVPPRSLIPNFVRTTWNFIPNFLAAHPTVAKVVKYALIAIAAIAAAAFVASSAVYFAHLATGKFIAPIVLPFASICATALNYAGVAATGKFVATSFAVGLGATLCAVRV